MKHTRIVVTHYGGLEALQVVEEKCPDPRDAEVRVKVLAAGVALPDLLMREGVHCAFSRMVEFVSVGSRRGQECALGNHRDDAATCVALVGRHETGP